MQVFSKLVRIKTDTVLEGHTMIRHKIHTLILVSVIFVKQQKLERRKKLNLNHGIFFCH
jgi:hypothetical protein